MYQRQGGVEESLYTSTLQPGQGPYLHLNPPLHPDWNVYLEDSPPTGDSGQVGGWSSDELCTVHGATKDTQSHWMHPTECTECTSTHYSSSKLCMLEFLFHFTCSFLTYNFYYLATNSLPPFLCLYTYIGCHFTSVVSVVLMKALSWIGLKHLHGFPDLYYYRTYIIIILAHLNLNLHYDITCKI